MNVRYWGGIATFLAILVMSACGADAESVNILRSGDRVVLVQSTDDSKDSAGVGLMGSVTWAGDCLGIDGRATYWPHGTTILAKEPFTIDVPGLGEIGVGDHVSGGGNSYELKELPSDVDPPPSGCTKGMILLFHPNR